MYVQRTVFDVGVLFLFAHGFDALRITLVGFGQLGDRRRHGGREQQRAALFRRFGEDEFQLFAETQIKHLVRFIQHHGADVGQVDVVAFDVVAQAARCRDDDMCATVQRTAFGACVHAANAGGHDRTGLAIQPRQFAADLHGQFAGRCNDQRQWRASVSEFFIVAQKGRCDGQTKGHCLAGPRLG